MKKYIISDSDIMSGAPVISGTRIPIARILYLLRDGYTLEQILKQYPHIKLKTLQGVIAELAEKVESKLYAPQISQT
ncbi:MAG: DUF433 domain-containing protein [Candidatus Levybacteria bacterium]|nr:DUF433 domain-containing protein [Candidatus Levybacteria bacterium]